MHDSIVSIWLRHKLNKFINRIKNAIHLLIRMIRDGREHLLLDLRESPIEKGVGHRGFGSADGNADDAQSFHGLLIIKPLSYGMLRASSGFIHDT